MWTAHRGGVSLSQGPSSVKTKLVLYHRTLNKNAQAILAHGFKDGTGYYLTRRRRKGVWLSDSPHERPDGPTTLLEVTLDLSDADLARYEWVEKGKSYREWLVSALIINAHGTVRIITEREERELD
jgi:hypothetical protein